MQLLARVRGPLWWLRDVCFTYTVQQQSKNDASGPRIAQARTGSRS